MHRPQLVTWNLDNTHCRDNNSTRLQEALHYTTLDVQHCNRILLVQYSIHIFNK